MTGDLIGQAVSPDRMAAINQAMSKHDDFEYQPLELPTEAEVVSAVLDETVIKNTNEILTESRFQKLAGI